MSKNSKLTRVKQLLAKSPNTSAKDVAKHLGVSVAYSYNLISSARKSLGIVMQADGTWRLKERMQQSLAPAVEAHRLALAKAEGEKKQNWETIHVTSSGQSILAGGPTEAELNGKGNVNHSALTMQVGGDHYKDMAIQPVEFCEKNKLSHLESNIVKRVCRWRNKDGLKDLLKIKHEVDLLIELNNLK